MRRLHEDAHVPHRTLGLDIHRRSTGAGPHGTRLCPQQPRGPHERGHAHVASPPSLSVSVPWSCTTTVTSTTSRRPTRSSWRDGSLLADRLTKRAAGSEVPYGAGLPASGGQGRVASSSEKVNGGRSSYLGAHRFRDGDCLLPHVKSSGNADSLPHLKPPDDLSR